VSDDPFGPDLKARLRAELDRVQPLRTSPRYLAGARRPISWRFAPAALAASLISILALSAFVATGSPNPAVWGHDVVTIIQSSSTTPTPPSRPTATPDTKPEPTPAHRGESPEPAEQPEPSGSSEPHESPQPSDDHSGDGSGSGGGDDSSGHEGSGSGGGDSRDGGSSDSDDTERS
jgi:uncharacterized membrane protein YgcG